MLRFDILGGEALRRVFIGIPEKFRKAHDAALERSAVLVESEAKKTIYEGRPDHLVGDSGHLRRSLTHRVHEDYAEIGTNLIYAPVHEFGATIRAKNAPRLVFRIREITEGVRVNKAGQQVNTVKRSDGQYFSALSVYIPPRPYLHPALEEMEPKIRETFNKAVEKVLKP